MFVYKLGGCRFESRCSQIFNMVTGVNVNVNLIEENVIQINGGIAENVDVTVNNVMYVKNIIFGILLHAVVKMKNI